MGLASAAGIGMHTLYWILGDAVLCLGGYAFTKAYVAKKNKAEELEVKEDSI